MDIQINYLKIQKYKKTMNIIDSIYNITFNPYKETKK